MGLFTLGSGQTRIETFHVGKVTTVYTHRTVAAPLIWASSATCGAGTATVTEVLLAIITTVFVGTVTSEVTRTLGTRGGAGVIAKFVTKVNVATISYPTILLIKMRIKGNVISGRINEEGNFVSKR